MRCNQELQNEGAAYPRTCALCGLGPCKTEQIARIVGEPKIERRAGNGYECHCEGWHKQFCPNARRT